MAKNSNDRGKGTQGVKKREGFATASCLKWGRVVKDGIFLSKLSKKTGGRQHMRVRGRFLTKNVYPRWLIGETTSRV